PEVTRVVDISGTFEKKIDANLCNVAKGPGGHHGSQLRAELAKQGKKLPMLGDDDKTADRNYIREFLLARDRANGQKYGVQYGAGFHYIGSGRARADDYGKQDAAPLQESSMLEPYSVRLVATAGQPLALDHIDAPLVVARNSHDHELQRLR